MISKRVATGEDHDRLGRTTGTVEAFNDALPGPNNDRLTRYSYDGDGHVLSMTAYLPYASGEQVFQQTAYIHGTTTGSGQSDVASNDLLTNVRYPDKTTGIASSSDQETFTYNALGERKTYQDRIATTPNIHSYGYDVLGRLTSDTVTQLGTGVNGSIRRLGYTFDSAGRPYQFISYSDTAGSSIIHELRRLYNGFGQLKTEYQEDAGGVNTSTSASVQYGYSELSGGNHSRLTSMTYPDGRVLEYNYTSGTGAVGIDDRISRLSYMDFSSAPTTHLEEYSYLGLGTVVRFAHPQNSVDLTYIKLSGETDNDGTGTGGGDQYIGLDRFGRIADQRWTTSGGTAKDRYQYGYDEDGNVMYRDNVQGDSGAATFDELYHTNTSGSGYDKLNRLTNFQRGTLNSSHDQITGTAARTQDWSLDALGNWNSISTNGTGASRTHNSQNQITNTNFTYDNNGNATKIGVSTTTYAFDAWNRLVSYTPSSTANVVTYSYDAMGRRIREFKPNATSAPLNHLYYSSNWQVILEQTTTGGGQQNGPDPGGGGDGGDLGTTTTGGGSDDSGGIHKPMVRSFATTGVTNRIEYVWSPVYVDAMVLRDKDAAGDGTYEERLYVQHDANFNVTAITNASGVVQERYVYDAYGTPSFIDGTTGWGSRSSSSFAWKYLFQDLRYDSNTSLYDMRTRTFSPTLGRAMQNEPFNAAYFDGMNLYQAYRSNATSLVDPIGLKAVHPTPGFGTGDAPGGGGQHGGLGGNAGSGPRHPGDGAATKPDFPLPDSTQPPATDEVPDRLTPPEAIARTLDWIKRHPHNPPQIQIPKFGVYKVTCYIKGWATYGNISCHTYILVNGVGYGKYAYSHIGGPHDSLGGTGVLFTTGTVVSGDESKYPIYDHPDLLPSGIPYGVAEEVHGMGDDSGFTKFVQQLAQADVGKKMEYTPLLNDCEVWANGIIEHAVFDQH